jgi:serine/threonine protein kinase
MLGGIPLLAKLGEGGMGSVYFGVHPRLNSAVAVKVLPLHLADEDPRLVSRFIREAQIAARVHSPHLIHVFDVNFDAGLYYLVMEYVHGITAGKLISELRNSNQCLSQLDAVDICLGAATGLLVAHEEGIIHRDIKPDNIMVPRSSVTRELDCRAAKLMDLGLARVPTGPDAAAGLTMTETALGTPGFMPPEQILDARTADVRSDIFALGATLYALIAGRPPFLRESAMKSLFATLNEPHAPLRDHRPDVLGPLIAITNRCLAKERGDRYADARMLVDDLHACRKFVLQKQAEARVALEPMPVIPPRPPPAPARGPSKKSAIKAALAAIAIFLVSGVAFLIYHQQRSTSPHPEETKFVSVEPEPTVNEQEVRRAQAAEEKRIANEKRLADEQRAAEQKRVADEQRKAEEQRKLKEQRQAEQQRLAEQQRTAEAQRKVDEQRKAEAEQKRVADEQRKAEEQRKLEEQHQAEQQRLAEQQRAAEAQRKVDEQRKAEAEQKRVADEKRKAEEQRKLEEQRQAEQQRLAEQQRAAEEQRRLAAAAEEKRRSQFAGLLRDADELLSREDASGAEAKLNAAGELDKNDPELLSRQRELAKLKIKIDTRNQIARIKRETERRSRIAGLLSQADNIVAQDGDPNEAQKSLDAAAQLNAEKKDIVERAKKISQLRENRIRRQKVAAALQNAEQALARNDWTEADRALDTAREIDPQSPQVASFNDKLTAKRQAFMEQERRKEFDRRVKLADVLLSQDDLVSARREILAAEKLYPRDPAIDPLKRRYSQILNAQQMAARRAEQERAASFETSQRQSAPPTPSQPVRERPSNSSYGNVGESRVYDE